MPPPSRAPSSWLPVLTGAQLVLKHVVSHSQGIITKDASLVSAHAKDLLGKAATTTFDSSTIKEQQPVIHESKEIQHTVPMKPIVVEPFKEKQIPITPPPKQEQKPPKQEPINTPQWTEKSVPSSPLSRIFGFGSLAAKLAFGTAVDAVSSSSSSDKNKSLASSLISDKNTERLVETLCTMRGAALKLGQMLSIQDESVVPAKLSAALDKVRQGAHIMPRAQLESQLTSELGSDWNTNVFSSFDYVPIAAASIGQVHRATTVAGDLVAVKIQYPGVADSITSDLKNLKRLVTYTNILPKGLYIDEIIAVGGEELSRECNYELEKSNQERFATFLAADEYLSSHFIVPNVISDASTARILTTSLVAGVPVDQITSLSQSVRNNVGRRILTLTIRELFNWRFMQTDPNWSNFIYNASTDKIALVDFGAALEYKKDFVDEYLKVVWAAANGDKQSLLSSSLTLGFLTGDESSAMIDAHVAAGMVVGEPFLKDAPFDFAKSQLTTRLAKYSSVFMQDRLTPPPQEAYSLHRKLAGAFLMCIKLQAVFPCRDVLQDVVNEYDFKQ